MIQLGHLGKTLLFTRDNLGPVIDRNEAQHCDPQADAPAVALDFMQLCILPEDCILFGVFVIFSGAGVISMGIPQASSNAPSMTGSFR